MKKKKKKKSNSLNEKLIYKGHQDSNRNVGGCIQLGFRRILKDFSMMKKSCGIQSRLLFKLKKSSGIRLGFSRLLKQSLEILWYSIKTF